MRSSWFAVILWARGGGDQIRRGRSDPGMLTWVAAVLIPIPNVGFDPTEVAVSWKVLCRLGHQVQLRHRHRTPLRLTT